MNLAMNEIMSDEKEMNVNMFGLVDHIGPVIRCHQ